VSVFLLVVYILLGRLYFISIYSYLLGSYQVFVFLGIYIFIGDYVFIGLLVYLWCIFPTVK